MTPDIQLLETLAQARLSLDHQHWATVLSQTQNLLIIQDLDGVCMGLKKDPRDRAIAPAYVRATQAFEGHFFVLTNGEHVGQRGVNAILDRAFPEHNVPAERLYLPGLAAGGVQWQDRDGQIAHPGVSAAELDFLQAVYHEMQQRLRGFLDAIAYPHPEPLLAASILDNIASPTANLNTAFAQIPEHYPALQQAFGTLMEELLAKARDRGLADSFFVHYAPNLGRDEEGLEILRPATTTDSGTTDFQFMLKGGIKEAGVAVLLNRYFGRYFGEFPLGERFNVREAPHRLAALTQLILDHFEPGKMPILVGVGDTVNSQVTSTGVRRGGSDRNFLQLIHNLKQESGQPHLTVYVDSSRGEVQNRRSLQVEARHGQEHVIAGPGDPADTNEPLVLNVAFPGGHEQYVQWFTQAAAARSVT